jgi:transcriptional regulator with XRE-family HTH domain
MGTLYERINNLCKAKGVSGSKMCLDLGLSKSTMSDLKYGRIKSISLPTAQKMAGYFGITVEELHGIETSQNKENPTVQMGSEVDEVTIELMDIIQNGSDEDRQDLLDVYKMLKRRTTKKG